MNTVKLFTGTSCPACHTLKDRLAKLKLTDYIECDVAEEEHRESIIALGFRSIPVLVLYNDHGSPIASKSGSTWSDSEYVAFFGGEEWGL